MKINKQIAMPKIPKIPKLDKRTKQEKQAEFESIPDLTTETKKEIGEQLQKIKEFENKYKEHWAFEGDSRYYFSICFKSGDDRDAFCEKYGIKLHFDDHCFYEEIQNIFKDL